jgi:hypothetical protein
MNFSNSLFTVEINQTPSFVFVAKWASEAEDMAFAWAEENADRLATKGSHGTDLPAVIKVRIARASERAAYLSDSGAAHLYQGVKIVYLGPPGPHAPG